MGNRIFFWEDGIDGLWMLGSNLWSSHFHSLSFPFFASFFSSCPPLPICLGEIGRRRTVFSTSMLSWMGFLMWKWPSLEPSISSFFSLLPPSSFSPFFFFLSLLDCEISFLLHFFLSSFLLRFLLPTSKNRSYWPRIGSKRFVSVEKNENYLKWLLKCSYRKLHFEDDDSSLSFLPLTFDSILFLFFFYVSFRCITVLLPLLLVVISSSPSPSIIVKSLPALWWWGSNNHFKMVLFFLSFPLFVE